MPTVLSLSLPAQPASFGTFAPFVSRRYETALAASVSSTAGNATLSVSDPSNPTAAYVPLAEATGAATSLLTWTAPVNADPVTIGFRQAIGFGDVLRAGTYSKTLTFTLSTTTP